MNRWAALLAVAGVSAGALLVFPRASGAPVDERTSPSQPMTVPGASRPETSSDSVHVKHELVVVPPPAVRVPQPRSRPVAARAVQPAAPPPPSAPSGLVTRAGRALVGDGRYRPEPFPRVDAEK